MLEITNKTKGKFCRRRANKLTAEILNFYKFKGKEVSLVVAGGQTLRRLNREFRGIDRPTDVLSFSAAQFPETNSLGEIFINIDEVRRPEKYDELFKRRRSQTYIFYFLLAHGLLHLVGHDDEQEKDRLAMVRLGEKFLERALLKIG